MQGNSSEAFLITREYRRVSSDPFPLRHFDMTSTFTKKRGFPHPPPFSQSFHPLFPFSPRSHSTSKHETLPSILRSPPPPPPRPPSPSLLVGFPPPPPPAAPCFLPFSRKPTSFSSPGLLYKTTKEHRGGVKMAVGSPTWSLVTHPPPSPLPPPFPPHPPPPPRVRAIVAASRRDKMNPIVSAGRHHNERPFTGDTK